MAEKHGEMENALRQSYELLFMAADMAGQSVFFVDSETDEIVSLNERAKAAERECMDVSGEYHSLVKQILRIGKGFSYQEIQCENCGEWISVLEKTGLKLDGRAVNAYICMDITQTKAEEAHRVDPEPTSDPLTGLINRRAGREMIMELLRLEQPFSISSIDLDEFESINTKHGYEQGDHVLKSFALTAREVLRNRDCLCRYSGDEFMAILPNCSRAMAREVMNRVQKKLDAQEDIFDLRFSFGISEYRPGQSILIEDMIDEANRTRYRAKTNKRMRK